MQKMLDRVFIYLSILVLIFSVILQGGGYDIDYSIEEDDGGETSYRDVELDYSLENEVDEDYEVLIWININMIYDSLF